MKPMIVLPPETMSKEDIQSLRDNGLCVVEAKNPALVRFVDPIASATDRPAIENAAIKLSRIILNRQWSSYSQNSEIGVGVFSRIFVDCLTEGTPLDRNGSVEQQERKIFDEAKRLEIQRLAREEAKEDRAAAKAAKAKK